MWCIPKVDDVFIARMENILDLYGKPYNPDEPVICFDEKSKELHAHTRDPQPAIAHRPRRYDYEYARNGTANIFLAVEPKAGFRTASVTERRTKIDFAHEIRRIIGLPRYRSAAKIHIVLDNLNTHFEQSLLDAFGKQAARSPMSRIQFHHTPVHASWLNMAEIEMSILSRQCVHQRISDRALLCSAMRAWQHRRNKRRATIQWKFTKDDARNVFKEYYPTNSVE
ncbi:IS630 family transposase [Candidatus Uhrbacteria bacterium]|nr:IS630 family transposase [Candidatus Uhrbacteria bacterium]